MKRLSALHIAFLGLLAAIVAGCSSVRHVPPGSFLLDDVKISLNDSTHTLNEQELSTYVRHKENNRMLWSAKMRLGVYNMSGKDSTKWYNRWLRKLGEPPVIYNPEDVTSDALQLQKAMVNSGFLQSAVYPRAGTSTHNPQH